MDLAMILGRAIPILNKRRNAPQINYFDREVQS